MKTISKLSAYATIACFTAVTLFTSSCQKEEDMAMPAVSSNNLSAAKTVPDNLPALLEVPAGNEICFHAYATGFQIYTCTQTAPGVYAWVFTAPEADLYANAGYNGNSVGTHYAGPTWESNSGSKVVGARLQGVTVDASAVPWLLLGAVSNYGSGVFADVNYIQRVNTVGGIAPASGANASIAGQQVRVPYTAEYFFYHPG
jgi:hypothetical protein